MRQDPPVNGSERDLLVGWLDFHRETLALKCAGLKAGQLDQRALQPSSLSLAGLVRHMAEIERTYFQRVFAGREIAALSHEDDPFRETEGADYGDAPDSDPRTALEMWRKEIEAARLVISETRDMADTGASGLPLRFWLVKTLNEYARHNGHADLLREQIDGQTGE